MNSFSNLKIKCIRGNPDTLSGILISYAIVKQQDIPQDLKSLVHNGIVSVESNYLNQKNIEDFFKNEFGLSLEEGLEGVIKQSGKMDSILDLEDVKEKTDSIKHIEYIPIPAKVGHFKTVDEMLFKKNADIYFLGEFESVHHAHLSINAFPILYQSQFREQEHRVLMQQIESMLSTVKPTTKAFYFKGDIKEHILKKLIPNIIYNIDSPKLYKKAKQEFEEFMQQFSFPEDIKKVEDLIQKQNCQ